MVLNAIKRLFTKDASLTVRPTNQDVQRAIRLRSKILGRALTHEAPVAKYSRTGTGTFISPQYDLAEIARASDVEPYISQSVRKHRELILKEGFEIKGEDEQMVEYVNRRLFEMSIVSGIPTESWIREGITNLIQYHNSSLVVRRDRKRSSGRLTMMYGTILEPIAAIFPLDPTTVEVKVDKYGTPREWRQKIQGAEKKFPPSDVIFITMDKPTGFTFGTPYILPVLDDIRALRRLEELAVLLATKEVFPLYHYKVGTDDHPAIVYDDGTTEIQAVQSSISSMPTNGHIVTSHRHTIELVSSKDSGLDIIPFLNYFESRVLGGLRLSPLDLGRASTANRGCYSGDTQTLTDSGWKYYWEIDINKDRIATVDPDTSEIKFQYANGKYVYPYTGPMYRFKTSLSECFVTPDHDMWAGVDSHWHKIHAEDIEQDVNFQTVFRYKGENPINSDLLELYAYFLQYGKLSKVRKEIKFIVFKEDLVDPIQSLLSRLTKGHVKAYDNKTYHKIVVINSTLYDLLLTSMACKVYPKRVPSDVVLASRDQIRKFLSIVLEGGLPSAKSCSFYYARTASISGQIQALCVLAGYVARELQGNSKPRLIIEEPESPTVHVSYIQDIKAEDYSGDVYCFNVPNHLFVTRYNGTVSVHGNTATNVSKNVEDAARDYQRAFSTVISHQLILPLLIEGGFNVTPENMVTLEFPIINREEARAQENHGLQIYMSGGITRTEFRRDYLSRRPLKEEEEKDTADYIVAKTESKFAIQSPARSAAGTVSNKATPTNQSGSKVKSRFKANDYKTKVRNFLDSRRKDIVSCETIEEIEEEMTKFISDFTNMAYPYLQEFINQGAKKAVEEANHDEDVSVGRRSKTKFKDNFIRKSIFKISKPYFDGMIQFLTPDQGGETAPYRIRPLYSALVSALMNLADTQVTVAERFGFIKAARIIGYDSIIIKSGANTIEVPISSGPIIYRNLIPKDRNETIELGEQSLDG